MQIHLLSVGTRMPRWVEEGYAEYAKRLPRECALRLVEIPAGRRGKGDDLGRVLQREAERLIDAAPAQARLLALDVAGTAWSTAELAERLAGWLGEGRDLALLVGGPDGLAES